MFLFFLTGGEKTQLSHIVSPCWESKMVTGIKNNDGGMVSLLVDGLLCLCRLCAPMWVPVSLIFILFKLSQSPQRSNCVFTLTGCFTVLTLTSLSVCLRVHAGTLGVLAPCCWKQPPDAVVKGVYKNGIWGKHNQNNELKEARNHLGTVEFRVFTGRHLIPPFSNGCTEVHWWHSSALWS